MKKENISKIVCYAIALAMGVATTILGALGKIEINTIAILLGIGMACIGIVGLDSKAWISWGYHLWKKVLGIW